MVERKQLDLYSLHRLVHEEGGLETVTKERKWSKIANRMNYPNGKNVGTILKGHYERVLYPYDIYMSGKIVDGAVSISETILKFLCFTIKAKNTLFHSFDNLKIFYL